MLKEIEHYGCKEPTPHVTMWTLSNLVFQHDQFVVAKRKVTRTSGLKPAPPKKLERRGARHQMKVGEPTEESKHQRQNQKESTRAGDTSLEGNTEDTNEVQTS